MEQQLDKCCLPALLACLDAAPRDNLTPWFRLIDRQMQIADIDWRRVAKAVRSAQSALEKIDLDGA